ncbi:MAG: metallophosphoesterase family protein [Chloroflexi bacterium]|nr:metallophosphoesterase family protein [Chloroflexota bacterium]
MGTVRVVCLSDTHLRRRRALPAWCLRRLEGADLILHAGDLVALSVLEELERLASVAAVRGNMDEIALRGRLPARRIAEIGGARIGLVHDPGPALGRTARLEQAFPGCDAVVFGHTHAPEIQRRGHRLILNPGSPTAPRSTLGATMLELRVSSDGAIEPTFVTP